MMTKGCWTGKFFRADVRMQQLLLVQIVIAGCILNRTQRIAIVWLDVAVRHVPIVWKCFSSSM